MENLLLPKTVKIEKGKKKNSATATIEPCYFGYGTTLGNALRRVLLSSLPGAAVTAVKIGGASHEFSSLPSVKEDVVEILLNLKKLNLTLHAPEARLRLKAKGKKTVTASDIEATSDAEIANPDLEIATLTDAKGELDMEIFAVKGRGYEPVEERETKSLDFGMIAVDSIFNPVVNIGYKIENMRVGDVTDYERLVLELETDGTIDPEEALHQSAQILVDHFSIVKGDVPEATQETEPEPEPEKAEA